MPFFTSYEGEGRIYAKYILTNHPGARVGALYQDDDYGISYLSGLKDGLGAKAESMIAMAAPYETTDPTVNAQIVRLKAAGADLLFVARPASAARGPAAARTRSNRSRCR
jgi:ABC-type branched-subunit amino acid transport system substrate-binding protein